MIHAANVRKRCTPSLVEQVCIKQRQGRALHTKSAFVKNKCCSVRDCTQQFSFQLWGSRAVGSESKAVALFQPLFLFWLRCPLMMVNFISLLIKRTSLQPSVLPSNAGWEMVSPGIKLREIQSDLSSSDLHKKDREKEEKKYSACSTCQQCVSTVSSLHSIRPDYMWPGVFQT